MKLPPQLVPSVMLLAVGAFAAATATSEDLVAAAAKHGGNATDAAHAGIWKVATPAPGTMRGEFASNDPIGIAAGVKIGSDCSLNWRDPDTGKLYCFSSATSLVYFLDAPHQFLSRAREQWTVLAPGTQPPKTP